MRKFSKKKSKNKGSSGLNSSANSSNGIAPQRLCNLIQNESKNIVKENARNVNFLNLPFLYSHQHPIAVNDKSLKTKTVSSSNISNNPSIHNQINSERSSGNLIKSRNSSANGGPILGPKNKTKYRSLNNINLNFTTASSINFPTNNSDSAKIKYKSNSNLNNNNFSTFHNNLISSTHINSLSSGNYNRQKTKSQNLHYYQGGAENNLDKHRIHHTAISTGTYYNKSQDRYQSLTNLPNQNYFRRNNLYNLYNNNNNNNNIYKINQSQPNLVSQQQSKLLLDQFNNSLILSQNSVFSASQPHSNLNYYNLTMNEKRSQDFLSNKKYVKNEDKRKYKIEKNGLQNLDLDEKAINNVKIDEYFKNLEKRGSKESLIAESGDINQNVVDTKNTAVHPRGKGLNFKNNSQNKEIILEVYGFDRSMTDDDIRYFLENISTNQDKKPSTATTETTDSSTTSPSVAVSSQNNYDKLPFQIEILVTGVAYVRFEDIKSAYFYHKNLKSNLDYNIKNNDQAVGKNIVFEFLPNIGAMDDKNKEPILVFINSKSGGGQGKEVFDELNKIFSSYQIYDLKSKPGPVHGLACYKNLEKYVILACGGDGTACWVMSVIEEMRSRYSNNSFMKPGCTSPAIAILPLGTGNDLARVCGMGGGYDGAPLIPILKKVINSEKKTLDRWAIQFETRRPEPQIKRLDTVKQSSIKNNFYDQYKSGPGKKRYSIDQLPSSTSNKKSTETSANPDSTTANQKNLQAKTQSYEAATNTNRMNSFKNNNNNSCNQSKDVKDRMKKASSATDLNNVGLENVENDTFAAATNVSFKVGFGVIFTNIEIFI